MKVKQFYVALLIGFLLVLPAEAQKSKRKPKQSGKAAATKQTAANKPKDALSEEDQLAGDKDRITPSELKRKLDAKEKIVIIDNRDGSAWIGSSVKLPGALHIPLSQLEERMNELPKDKEIVTYCT